MDTPKSKPTSSSNNNKLINPSSSDSPAFQESPIFNYISNLSPIPPVKTEPVAQGFPGLASPPLVFRSPRITSLSSLFNRKLLSSGSNPEFSQENDKRQKSDGDPGDAAKLDPAFHSLLILKDQKTCNTKKLVEVAQCSPSGCVDEYLTDPTECANSLFKTQFDDIPQSSEGCLKKKDNDSYKDMHLDGSTPLKLKESAEAKSRISIKVVKNEARGFISSSSECLSTLPTVLTDYTSKAGDSSNEASHLERGTLRRCLFDEDQRKYSDGSEFWNPNDNPITIQELPNMSPTETSGDRDMANLSKCATGLGVSPGTGNYTVANSKPLGIGLHLNSVVYPRSMDSANGNQQSSVLRVEGKNSGFVMRNQSDEEVNVSNSVKKVLASSEERHQTKACSGTASAEGLSLDAVEQSYDPILLKPSAPASVIHDKRKLSLELAESNQKSNQVSPKKKRKKASSTSDDDNSKRCNCRKTKCLKLYCDCFAAGFYCGESCACQGCFNRPEYEGTVLETRQQIESRNPLAFAPKVVPVADSPASSKEVGNLSTPSSARHKRGCNCKKSMCLKKYCECYQANVGCSDGCRCEGCKNVYGIREDYSFSRELRIRKAPDEMSEGLVNGRQEISIVGSNFVNSRVHNSPSLTPITPALQCSDLRKNALRSRLPFRRVLQTPDSHHDMFQSHENSPTSPEKSQSHSMLLEKSEESIDVGALDAERCLENTEDRLEPAGDDSTSASCSAQMSNSDVVSIVPSSSSKTTNLRNISQPQLFGESGLPPISSSLRWRSSPMTPVTQSTGNQDFGSGSKHSDLLEDDTPDILKNSSTPVKSVKVSSPNKKRVSPPHNNLKVCRKFVLRALPTFLPLTPYSKNGNDNISEPSET